MVLTCFSVNRGANGSLCGPLPVLFEVKPDDRTSRLESRENTGSTFTIPVISDSHIINYFFKKFKKLVGMMSKNESGWLGGIIFK